MTAPRSVTVFSRDVRVRAAFYLPVLLSYLCAGDGDDLTFLQAAIFALASLFSLAVEHRWSRPFFSTPLKIGLVAVGAVLFLLFLLIHVPGTGARFPSTVGRFLFWNSIVFLLSRNKSEYDLWTLAIIAVSLFMISAAFLQPPLFLPAFAASLLSVLVGFHRAILLRSGLERTHRGLGLLLPPAHFALVAVLSAAIFLAFPRDVFRTDPARLKARDVSPLPLPEGPAVSSVDRPIRSGMGSRPDTLDLTNLEKLLVDPTPVLRVRTTLSNGESYRPAGPFYIRGVILDRYENGRWTAEFRKETRTDEEDGSADGSTTLSEIVSPGRTEVHQHVRMSPLPGAVCFAMPDPVRISLPRIEHDRRGLLFFPASPVEPIEYGVVSLLPVPADHPPLRLVAESSPAPDLLPCLRVPDNLKELDPLAARFRTHPRPWDRMDAIRKYLLEHCRYRLGPFVPRQGRDATEHFLLAGREGYCIHFASAMALLARAAGLPARVAAGFHVEGEPGEDGSHLVRNSDAHAWAEIHFEEYGWIIVDPTPSAPPPESLADRMPSSGRDRPDRPENGGERNRGAADADRRWDDFLLGYDPSAQSRIARAVARVVSAVVNAAARVLSSPLFLVLAAVLLAAAALAWRSIPASGKRRVRRALVAGAPGSTVDFYRDLLWILSRHGIRKPPAMTGWEFSDSLSPRPWGTSVRRLTDWFYRVKFGCGSLTEPERREATKILDDLESALSKSAPVS